MFVNEIVRFLKMQHNNYETLDYISYVVALRLREWITSAIRESCHPFCLDLTTRFVFLWALPSIFVCYSQQLSLFVHISILLMRAAVHPSSVKNLMDAVDIHIWSRYTNTKQDLRIKKRLSVNYSATCSVCWYWAIAFSNYVIVLQEAENCVCKYFLKLMLLFF